MTTSEATKIKTHPRVGVIGLGIMGSAIATHLVTAGYQTFGYDPDKKCSEQAATMGVITQASAIEVAARSEIILLSLPHDQALNETVTHILNSPAVMLSKPILMTPENHQQLKKH